VQVFLDEGKTVDSRQQLTVTMFFIIVMEFLELRIPIFLVRLVVGIENETNFFKLLSSFRIHNVIFEACTLIVDPSAE
jgi:type III secretory pathway component EscV